ncbi:MAG: sigma-70 family RNA polymerase sigma factor [Anaerostipes sp.]|nr:sigma-70 family RNA polymerase sigma factor [Anaerostipes sp.]
MLIFNTMINNESDKEKFNQIYHKYKNLVFYVAYQRLQDEYLAEDVVQETFLSVAKSISAYYNIYSRKTKNLIGKIALDRTIDFIRKQKKVSLEEDIEDKVLFSISDTELLPLEQLITKENYHELLKTMNELPEKDKTILQFVYIYEYSAAESARMLEITYKAATNRLYRAKQKLQIKLRENKGGI